MKRKSRNDAVIRVNTKSLCAIAIVVGLFAFASISHAEQAKRPARLFEPKASKTVKTMFQVNSFYDPRIDLGTDAILTYTGAGVDIARKIDGYASAGYNVIAMTSISHDYGGKYVDGAFDGKRHEDEIQLTGNGNQRTIEGRNYYMTPTENWNRYLVSQMTEALKSGAMGFAPEEPEYWSDAGYEEAFKREWAAFYKTPWIAPQSSVGASWKASKLKSHLYARSAQSVCGAMREWEKEHGGKHLCIIPTHSLLNYSAWNIVFSPGDVLNYPEVDGYIGQVWTGTTRTPVVLDNVEKSRFFESAYLEYSYFANLVRGTKKKVWFLADPVEDNPGYSWDDYRSAYHESLVAKLLWPSVNTYEIMPWPERVFVSSLNKIPAPPEYLTELLGIFAALQDMPAVKESSIAGSRIGVLVGDTMPWTRWNSPDPKLTNFYGLALPLISNGVPVDVVTADTSTAAKLKPYGVLLLSYGDWTPKSEKLHKALLSWVKSGGTLVVFGSDMPFHHLKEWWVDQAALTPYSDLFQKFGFDGEKLSRRSLLERIKKSKVISRAKKDAADKVISYKTDLSTFALSADALYLRIGCDNGDFGESVTIHDLKIKNSNSEISLHSGAVSQSMHLEEKGKSAVVDKGRRRIDCPSGALYKLPVSRGEAATLFADISGPYELSIVTSFSPVELKPVKGVALPSFACIRPDAGITFDSIESSFYKTATSKSAGFRKAVGLGQFVFIGAPVSCLSYDENGSEKMMMILRRLAPGKSKPLESKSRFIQWRGPYVAVRTMNEPYKLQGAYVDMFNGTLDVVESPEISAETPKLFKKWIANPAKPTAVAVSGRIRKKSETATKSTYVISGPEGATGCVRISTGQNEMISAYYQLGDKTKRLTAAIDETHRSAGACAPLVPEGVKLMFDWKSVKRK